MAASDKTRIAIRPDGAIHVHVTPDVMFSFEKSSEVRKAVLGRLGHPTCTSGFRIEFTLQEREFAV